MMPLPWFWEQFVRGRRPSPEVSTYRLLEYQAFQTNNTVPTSRNAERTLDADGDTLTIASVVGSAPVYVRVGAEGNPFIRVFERMTIRRPFQKVTFRLGQNAGALASASKVGARVWAYASHGPLIEWPAKEYGFKRQPLARYGVPVGTSAVTLENILFGDNAKPATFGKGGGTLIVKNTGSAELYIYPGSASSASIPAGSFGFGPLAPGESVSLQLEQHLGHDKNGSPADGGIFSFATLAGATTISLLCSSPEADDAGGDWDDEHKPGMR